MKNQKQFVLPLSVVALGIAIGLSSGLLSLFLDWTEHSFLGFEESSSLPAAYHVPPFQRFVSVSVGGIVVALIWWLLRTRFQRVPTISETMLRRKMAFFPTITHVLAQIFYVGTGGSVGRELAPREAGALFAQQWGSLLQKTGLAELSNEDYQLLIAAAAGAGFAGVYIAPLTGMFFCVEILLHKMTLRTISVSLPMCAISMMIGAAFKGTHPYYAVGKESFPLTSLFLAVIIAPLCGLVGAFFRHAFLWAEKKQNKKATILWQLPLAALITGVIAMYLPQIMGNGRALAQTAMNTTSRSLIPLLLLGALLKAFVTLFTIRVGASGGTLTPSIAIGGAIGATIGLIFPNAPIWQAALLGASAFLAVSQRAPLMSLFMLTEVSHLPLTAAVPLGLGVALATGTAQILTLSKTES